MSETIKNKLQALLDEILPENIPSGVSLSDGAYKMAYGRSAILRGLSLKNHSTAVYVTPEVRMFQLLKDQGLVEEDTNNTKTPTQVIEASRPGRTSDIASNLKMTNKGDIIELQFTPPRSISEKTLEEALDRAVEESRKKIVISGSDKGYIR